MQNEERASMPLAGGIMQCGYQCGMVWGAALAAGAQAYRRFGPGPQAEAQAIIAAQGLVAAFRAGNHHVDCVELTGINASSSIMQMVTYFLLKGGVVRCFRMAADYAPVAFQAVDAALSAGPIDVPEGPVSCAAELARRMGASDVHAATAAGLAGGIGLSGGGCGALGAAIWLLAMNFSKEGGGQIGYKHPQALAVVDRLMECTDANVACAQIVGRRFESVQDHADYVRDGGCAEVIEALAAV
jgi:hypothetical protein